MDQLTDEVRALSQMLLLRPFPSFLSIHVIVIEVSKTVYITMIDLYTTVSASSMCHINVGKETFHFAVEQLARRKEFSKKC